MLFPTHSTTGMLCSINNYLLPSGRGLYCLLMASDQQCTCNLQDAGSSPEQLQVFPWFSQRVLARCSDNSITHHDLLKQLSADRCVHCTSLGEMTVLDGHYADPAMLPNVTSVSYSMAASNLLDIALQHCLIVTVLRVAF